MTGAAMTEAPARVEGPPRRPVRGALVAAARVTGVVLVVVLATVAGIGWVDLLRHAAWLNAGPRLREALPLQRLAHNGAQPLAHVVVAWLPAGLAAGAALYALGLRSRLARAALVLAGCALLLLALGGASDAISESDPLTSHLAQQPHRAAVWVAAALAAAGSAVAGRRRWR